MDLHLEYLSFIPEKGFSGILYLNTSRQLVIQSLDVGTKIYYLQLYLCK